MASPPIKNDQGIPGSVSVSDSYLIRKHSKDLVNILATSAPTRQILSVALFAQSTLSEIEKQEIMDLSAIRSADKLVGCVISKIDNPEYSEKIWKILDEEEKLKDVVKKIKSEAKRVVDSPGIHHSLTAALFSQVLSKEPRWYTLGVYLGAKQAELTGILTKHSKDIMRCYIEVYNCLQTSVKCLSWDDIVTSLKRMDNTDLAKEIESQYILSSKYVKVKSPLIVEIATEFEQLSNRLISLLIDVKRAFKKSTVGIAEIQDIIESKYNLLPLSNEEAKIDPVFTRLNRYCSVLNFCGIVFLVESQLKAERVLRKKLADFEKAVDQFNTSTKMVELAELVKEKQQTLTGNDKILKLVVRKFWGEHTIKQFQYVANEILGVVHNVTADICISKGSICISWVIPDINATKLVPDHSLEFVKIIGIISLRIGSDAIYNIEGEGCETIEAAMLLAMELKNTKAIELLLAMGCNPEIATYTGDNAVTTIVNIRESKKSSVDHVCIIGHNEHVEAIVDPTSKPAECSSCTTKEKIIKQLCQQNHQLQLTVKAKDGKIEDLMSDKAETDSLKEEVLPKEIEVKDKMRQKKDIEIDSLRSTVEKLNKLLQKHNIYPMQEDLQSHPTVPVELPLMKEPDSHTLDDPLPPPNDTTVQVESPHGEPSLVKEEPPLAKEEPPLVKEEPPLVKEEPPLVKEEPPLVKEELPLVKDSIRTDTDQSDLDHDQQGSLSSLSIIDHEKEEAMKKKIHLSQLEENEKLKGEIRSLESQLKAQGIIPTEPEILQVSLALESRVPILYFHSKGIYPPLDITMNAFSLRKDTKEHWFSPSFYSHREGYKMCLKLRPSGQEEGEGTHLSAYIHIMSGIYDHRLSWPFNGIIKLQLLNQRADSNHIDTRIVIDESSDILARRRVSGGIITESGRAASSGKGIPKLISHDNLSYNPTSETEYLKDDAVFIRIKEVVINAERISPTSFSSAASLKESWIAECRLPNYRKLRKKNEKWKSDPFYTIPPNKGYKFILAVHTNGKYPFVNESISIYTHLLKGENDDNLSFPFRGVITVHLVNQIEDKEHIEANIVYSNPKVTSSFAGDRVKTLSTGSRFFDSNGWGYADFARQKDLEFNEGSNTKYLNDDELLFRIFIDNTESALTQSQTQ